MNVIDPSSTPQIELCDAVDADGYACAVDAEPDSRFCHAHQGFE